MIVIIALRLLVVANITGQPKEGDYSFLSTLISNSLLVGLLIWGGFFLT